MGLKKLEKRQKNTINRVKVVDLLHTLLFATLLINVNL